MSRRPGQNGTQFSMKRGIDLPALGARAEHDTLDQATKSLGGLSAVFRTVQSIGQMGDLLGVE
jgi:hypothetical protein